MPINRNQRALLLIRRNFTVCEKTRKQFECDDDGASLFSKANILRSENMEAVFPRAVHICTTPNYSGTWKGANVKLLIAAVKCKWCSAERVVIALGEEGHIRSAAPTSCSVPWKDLCTDRAPLCERLKLRRQMLVSKKQHLKEGEGGIDTHVPKTSFKSYLSSTVGVLGFTTSSAFLLSGFFFPPKSGMMAAVAAVFSFAFFVFCSDYLENSLLATTHSAHGDRRVFTVRARDQRSPAIPATLSPDFLSLAAAASYSTTSIPSCHGRHHDRLSEIIEI